MTLNQGNPCKQALSVFAICVSFLFDCALGETTTHALLVGVSEYPSLDKSQWLVGPVNDVALVKEVLSGARYKVSGENITALSGWPTEEQSRPTKANIKKAYESLASKAKEGDIVFILMSGHGSQQPANPDPKDIETDGLDEVFLPADTTTWDPEARTITGAITDDEIKVWTDAIRKKGALVWIVFDSCHSGTMTRGTAHAQRVNRRIDPALLIPAGELASGSAVSRSVNVEKGSDLTNSEVMPGKLVAMYAAQSLEPTFELPLPPPEGLRRGLFCTTIMDVLVASSSAISYRDLAETVAVIYSSNGVLQPTPLIEGDGLDLPVLGHGKAPERADVIFTGMAHPKYGFEINAGHLHGLRKSTILDVIPAAIIGGEKSLGTVKITHAEATRSYVQPHAWEKHPAAPMESLGAACRARILYENAGLATLSLAVQVQDKKGDWTTVEPEGLSESQAGTVKVLTKQAGGLYRVVTDAKDADWFLQLDSRGGGVLVAASGFSNELSAARFSSDSPKTLADNLAKIARARQLIHIAGTSSKDSSLPVKVELVRFDSPGSEKGTVIAYKSEGRQLSAGDEICFRITNKAPVAIDVTLLHIDDAFAISALYPAPGTVDDNRIPPNAVFETPRMEVSAERAMREQVAVIAVRATRERQDFTCLEQPSLETTRGEAALQTPLGKLLSSTVYGTETTRGLRRAESGSYTTRLLTWTANP